MFFYYNGNLSIISVKPFPSANGYKDMENSLYILRYLALDDIGYKSLSRIIFEIGFNNNRRADGDGLWIVAP
jgi:hypothetical protein